VINLKRNNIAGDNQVFQKREIFPCFFYTKSLFLKNLIVTCNTNLDIILIQSSFSKRTFLCGKTRENL
jgi:hypothetical protein